MREIMLKSREETRGGYNKPKKLKLSQALLLKYIWEGCGGIELVSRNLQIHHQLLINWKLRGSVPLVMCGKLARKLELSVYAFNYEDVAAFQNRNIDWVKLVKEVGEELKFSKETVNLILAGEHPTPYECE